MNARKRRKLRKHFDNPYYDQSDPAETGLWDQELTVIRRVRGGETLVQQRLFHHEHDDPNPDGGTHCIAWYWAEPYQIQWDGPITRLMSRGIIRSVRCAGGATHMILTEKATEYFTQEET
jgi:hypothetical protein